MNTEKFIGILLGTAVVTSLLLMIFAIGFASYQRLKIFKAKTSEEIKTACTSDWNASTPLESLPAKCREFYSQGVVLK